jgi:sugar/nucleoside kinase (ribokinase family)
MCYRKIMKCPVCNQPMKKINSNISHNPKENNKEYDRTIYQCTVDDVWATIESIEDGLRLLHEQAPKLTVIVKDGSNGAYYWDEHGIQHVPALKVEKVLNATGAGDSFNAGVITALKLGKSMADAVSYGCKIAAAKIKAEAPPLLY